MIASWSRCTSIALWCPIPSVDVKGSSSNVVTSNHRDRDLSCAGTSVPLLAQHAANPRFVAGLRDGCVAINPNDV